MASSPEHRFGLSDILMLAAVVMWGINFSFIKIALRELSPNAFNGWRISLTAVGFLVLLALSGQGFRVPRRDFWKLLLLGVAGNAVYQAIFIHGASQTSAASSSLILSTSPIFVALLSAVLGIERIHWAAWLGIFVSVAGLFIVITANAGGLRLSGTDMRGDALILLGTIFWAVGTVLAKPFLETMTPLKYSAITVALGALFYIPTTMKDMLAVSYGAVSLKAWLCLVLSALFGLIIGYLIWYYSVRRVGNARTAAYNNLTPIFTALFAAWLLGERLSLIQAVGAVVILAGVYVTRTGYRFFPGNRPIPD
jgi:drug/metabolite transporter (DMT)-like permease